MIADAAWAVDYSASFIKGFEFQQWHLSSWAALISFSVKSECSGGQDADGPSAHNACT
jgi:hypothetical protein